MIFLTFVAYLFSGLFISHKNIIYIEYYLNRDFQCFQVQYLWMKKYNCNDCYQKIFFSSAFPRCHIFERLLRRRRRWTKTPFRCFSSKWVGLLQDLDVFSVSLWQVILFHSSTVYCPRTSILPISYFPTYVAPMEIFRGT